VAPYTAGRKEPQEERPTMLRSFIVQMWLLVACAVSQVGVEMEKDTGEPGVIVGIVMDSGKRALADVRVYIREVGQPQIGSLHYVLTDQNGRFRFDKLRLSSFEVFAVPSNSSSFVTRHGVSVRLTPDRQVQHVVVRMSNGKGTGVPAELPRGGGPHNFGYAHLLRNEWAKVDFA
jgi:hypothetical protein